MGADYGQAAIAADTLPGRPGHFHTPRQYGSPVVPVPQPGHRRIAPARRAVWRAVHLAYWHTESGNGEEYEKSRCRPSRLCNGGKSEGGTPSFRIAEIPGPGGRTGGFPCDADHGSPRGHAGKGLAGCRGGHLDGDLVDYGGDPDSGDRAGSSGTVSVPGDQNDYPGCRSLRQSVDLPVPRWVHHCGRHGEMEPPPADRVEHPQDRRVQSGVAGRRFHVCDGLPVHVGQQHGRPRR